VEVDLSERVPPRPEGVERETTKVRPNTRMRLSPLLPASVVWLLERLLQAIKMRYGTAKVAWPVVRR
jgi:hypothetical protein